MKSSFLIVVFVCLFVLPLSAQNLIQNSGFDDDSAWQVVYHIPDPVSEVVFPYADATPAKGEGACLYVSAFGEREVRPVIYQEFKAIAGETYFVTGALQVRDLDLPETIPPGPWFQIYINEEEPPEWYDGMPDWNPSTKLLNISAWSPEGCELYDINNFWEALSCENDFENGNLPYFTAQGDPGTEVTLYLVMKPGLWLNEGDTGGWEVLIDNIGVFPTSSNLIQNSSFEDDSAWEVVYHIPEPVSDVVFPYADAAPAKGEGSCLYVSAFGEREVRPVIYQPFKAIAGEPYRVSAALQVRDLDLPETVPPGPWFQIYINDEEPPEWYDGMGDWNPSTKLLNLSAWGPEDCEIYDVNTFWEAASCENDFDNGNLPYFTPAGEAGTEVELFLVMKPGLWLNEGDTGGWEVLIDNVSIYPLTEAGKIGTRVAAKTSTPSNYVLEQNYPNPFNPNTTISFTLPQQENITLEVFDLLGKKVATLLSDENKQAGRHAVEFDASELSSGLYLYKLQTQNHTFVNKMMLVK